MKTKIFVLALLAVLILPSFAKEKKNGWEKHNLKGKVKIRIRHIYDFEENKKIFKYKSIFKYDSLGNQIEWIDITIEDNSKKIYKYFYDDKSNNTEVKIYNKYGDLIEKLKYKYDSYGNIIEFIIHNSLQSKSKYKYDSLGNKIEWARYNSHGNLSWIYKYDSKGNDIEKIDYNHLGKVSTTTKYIYDTSGRKFEVAKYFADGRLSSKYTYIRYSNGKCKETRRYDTYSGLNTIWKNIYDSTKSKLLMKMSYSEGILYRKTYFNYDIIGNEIKEAKYRMISDTGKEQEISDWLVTHEYEYYE